MTPLASELSPPLFSARWIALFPVIYLAHLIDERYTWIGTADFATQYLGIYFTNRAWWWVNVPSMALLTFAAAWTARGRWPRWVAVSLGVHLALHGLGRVPTSLWTLKIAPGLPTGLLLCTPLALATLWRGWHGLPRPELWRGAWVGVASFQPFWHFALLPFLPGPPSAG